MSQMFSMNKSDLRKLERFFKRSPKQFKAATANILNSLAFTTKRYDQINIERSMIVRNRRFVQSSLRVQTARSSSDIDRQISIAYSVKRPRFSGWVEQEYGRRPKRRRTVTKHARGGNMRSAMKSRARLRPAGQFYKPEQFQGRSLQQRFYFMMRVLNSRGGGEFIITNPIHTNRGALGPGLYGLKNHQIKRYQKFQQFQPRRIQWRTMSIRRLMSKNNIRNIWRNSLRHILQRYK